MSLRNTLTKIPSKTISYKEALAQIISFCEGLNHPIYKCIERDASITHWLNHPESIPLFGDIKLRSQWISHLYNYATQTLIPEANYIEINEKNLKIYLDISNVPFPPKPSTQFEFIDLFAGIGGIRLALQSNEGKCVFSSEWDKGAKNTYFNNFGEVPFGDINQFSGLELTDEEVNRLIPQHDVLAAGFPCQPFSLAGVSARESLGKTHGFACEAQGTLFFNIVRIAKVKQPKVILLENVKNLYTHDKGRTFEVIKNTIETELGYSFSYKIINSKSLVPQKRERCYMVAFKNGHKFDFPEFSDESIPLKSILEESPPDKYTISDKLWQGHINRTKRNVDRGTGFTAYTADLDKPANTLVARYGKDGKECLIPQEGKNPRKLTLRECARLQGFPESYVIPTVDTPGYRQFGNSVAVPVIEKIANAILKQMKART